MLKSPIKISAAARARLVIDMEQLRPAAGVELIPAILWEKYEVSERSERPNGKRSLRTYEATADTSTSFAARMKMPRGLSARPWTTRMGGMFLSDGEDFSPSTPRLRTPNLLLLAK